MDFLYELKCERDRIDAAIRALSGTTVGGVGRRDAQTPGTPVVTGQKRRLSAAARKKISIAAKARWAKAKKAGKTSLSNR